MTDPWEEQFLFYRSMNGCSVFMGSMWVKIDPIVPWNFVGMGAGCFFLPLLLNFG